MWKDCFIVSTFCCMSSEAPFFPTELACLCKMQSFGSCRVRILLCVILINVLFFNVFSIYQLSHSKTNWARIHGPFYALAFFPRSCKELRLPDKPLTRTALVGFPGSGTTWLRYLIQQATGLMTGSMQVDSHLKSSFPGEGINNSSMLVVRTRDYRREHIASWEKAVILLRNPYDSILIEYYRRVMTTPIIGEKLLAKLKRGWQRYVRKQPLAWFRLNLEWLQHFQGALFVIHYEKLKAKPVEEMKRLLHFLGQHVTDHDLNCMLKNSYNYLKMKPRVTNVTSHFSRSLQAEINRYRARLYRVLSDARNKKKWTRPWKENLFCFFYFFFLIPNPSCCFQ